MKGSASGQLNEPSNSQRANFQTADFQDAKSQFGSWGVGSWALLLSAAYLAAHLPSLAPSLEDIDSLNFALGLRDFEPALHQPHPPGYPVYIALGRASLAVVSRVAPSLDRLAAEAFALAIWSAIGGAVAIVAAAA